MYCIVEELVYIFEAVRPALWSCEFVRNINMVS